MNILFKNSQQKGKVLLIGNGAEKCKDLLKDHENIHYNTDAVPSAKDMVALSYKKFKENNFENVAYFEPYYLKDFILQKNLKYYYPCLL